MFKHINQISEQSLVIDFGDQITLKVNNTVNLFAQKIINNHKKIKELNIGVHFLIGHSDGATIAAINCSLNLNQNLKVLS